MGTCRLLATIGATGCTGYLYDTTTHFGGSVSLRVTPIDTGIGLEVEAPGAPANEDLGACRSYMTLQEPRRRDTPPNRFLELCFTAVPVDGPCFTEPSEAELVVLEGAAILWITGTAGEELSADAGALADFAYAPEGSLAVPIVLDDACLGGPAEHLLEATWSFDRSETYPEGVRSGRGEGIGDV